MKYILTILMLFGIAHAQYVQDSAKYIRYETQYGMRMPRIWADSAFNFPIRDTTYRPQRAGAIVAHPSSLLLYYWDGTSWETVGSGLSNAPGSGDSLLYLNGRTIRLVADEYGIITTQYTNELGFKADTVSSNSLVTKYMLGQVEQQVVANFESTSIYEGYPGDNNRLIFWRNDSTLILRTPRAGYGLIGTSLSDTTSQYKVDTSSMATKWYAQSLSMAGAENFANADLTFTDNRTHDLDGNSLNITINGSSFWSLESGTFDHYNEGSAGSYFEAYGLSDATRSQYETQSAFGLPASLIQQVTDADSSRTFLRSVFSNARSSIKLLSYDDISLMDFQLARNPKVTFTSYLGVDSIRTIFPISATTNTGAYALAHDTVTGQIVRIPASGGGGGTDYNFAEDNLTLTGNRTHSFGTNAMVFTFGGANSSSTHYIVGNDFQSDLWNGSNNSLIQNTVGSDDNSTIAIISATGSSLAYFYAKGDGTANIKGNVILTDYNAGHTGSLDKVLAVDASGNVIRVDASVGNDGGVLTLSAIGATPNANGATITGTVLNLQPANNVFGGVVTLGAQQLGTGVKTFGADIVVSGINFGVGGGNSTTNVRAGIGALANTSSGANNNAAFGALALGNLASASGDNNTAVGYHAGMSITNLGNNSYFGYNAGALQTTGQFNSYLGANSGPWQLGGSFNNMLGYNAGSGFDGGNYNVIIGHNAGISPNTALYTNKQNNSIYIGLEAGSLVTANPTGVGNIGIGNLTGKDNTGRYNTMLGANIGLGNTADTSVMFGYNIGTTNTQGGRFLVGINARNFIDGNMSYLVDSLRFNSSVTVRDRFLVSQGAAIAAANNLTLGQGNVFSITGTTQINAITTSLWKAGAEVTLIFASTPTVKNNTAGGAGTAVLRLAGGVDFAATANDVLKLVYNGTAWYEVSRSVN